VVNGTSSFCCVHRALQFMLRVLAAGAGCCSWKRWPLHAWLPAVRRCSNITGFASNELWQQLHQLPQRIFICCGGYPRELLVR
jgi:hypothetical protein